MVINRKCMNTWRKTMHVYVTERRLTSSTVPSGQTQPWTGSAHASRGEFGLEQVLRHDRGEKIREPGHWLTSGHERSVQFHTPRAQTLQTHSSQTLLHISCAWSCKTWVLLRKKESEESSMYNHVFDKSTLKRLWIPFKPQPAAKKAFVHL